MDLGKLKEFIMNDNVFIVSVLIAIVTLIGSITFYQYNELQSIKSNVESAIVKGIDPIAVRCAYAHERDTVCVAYAASSQIVTPKPAK
jgi:uncharacterized membrane protein